MSFMSQVGIIKCRSWLAGWTGLELIALDVALISCLLVCIFRGGAASPYNTIQQHIDSWTCISTTISL